MAHHRKCALMVLAFALCFPPSIGQSDVSFRDPMNKKEELVEAGFETSSGHAVDTSGAPQHAATSSLGTNSSDRRSGPVHWAIIALVTLLGWTVLSVAWLFFDAKRRRRLNPTCYGRLSTSYVMRTGFGEVPALSNEINRKAVSVERERSASEEKEEVAKLRGRVIWAIKEEVLTCLGRSIFHEGWRSVRTADEAGSALVVQVLPVEPGRRAALCVWLSSLSAAAAVAVVLTLTTLSTSPSLAPSQPPDSLETEWNGALPMPFTEVLLPLLFLVALMHAEAEVLLKGSLKLALGLAAVAALFMQHPSSSSSVAAVAAAALLVLALWLVGVRARAHLLPLGWWEDPLLPGCRRLPTHPPRRLFPSVEAAARGLLATKHLVENGAARAAVLGVPPPAGADAYADGEDDLAGAEDGGDRVESAATVCPGKRARGLKDVDALMQGMPEGSTGLGTWGLDSGGDHSGRRGDGNSGSIGVSNTGSGGGGGIIGSHHRKQVVNPWAMSLDGDDWRFKFVGGPEQGMGFESPSFMAMMEEEKEEELNEWVAISVPGTWQVQGQEPPRYTNIRYPIFHPPRDKEPATSGRNKRSENPTGLYRRTFEVPPVWPGGKLSQFDLEPVLTANDETVVPPSWAAKQGEGGEGEVADAEEWRRAQSVYQHRGRRVVLVIKGASSAVEVFMNSVWVGCSKDSFLECEFDVTNALLKGPGNKIDSSSSGKKHSSSGGPFHVLALRVAHWSDGSYLEDQDQWWLSGLHRSVELHCLPAVHFASLSATTQHLAWTSTTSGASVASGGAFSAAAASVMDDASIISPVDQQSKMSSTSSISMLSSVSRHRDYESQAKDVDEAKDKTLPIGPSAAYAVCAVHMDIAGLALLVPPPSSSKRQSQQNREAPLNKEASAIANEGAAAAQEGGVGVGAVDEKIEDAHDALDAGSAIPAANEVSPAGEDDEEEGTPANSEGGAAWDLRVWLLPPDADSIDHAVASCALRLDHSLVHTSSNTTSSTGASDSGMAETGGLNGSDGVNVVGVEVQPLLRPDPKTPSQQLFFCTPKSTIDENSSEGVNSHGSPSYSSSPASADPENALASSAVSVADARCLPVCSVKIYLQVPAPLLWSAEAPHCYSCVASLSPLDTGKESSSPTSKRRSSSRTNHKKVANSKKSNLFSPISSKGHVEGCRVGLKEVAVLTAREAGLVEDDETTDNGGRSNNSGVQVADHKVLCVNRRAIRVRGVNRHEHDGFTGKAMSYAAMLRDAALMKTLHFNAVRCSHYPNHSGWYRLCDEIGLYVVDEANIEAHGAMPMGRFAMDSAFQASMLARAQRMMARDVAHPSIIVWSLGNESGAGPNLMACRNILKQADPCQGRPVQYEGGGAMAEGNGCSRLTDIICPMYASAAMVMSYAAKGDRPVILCEYAHAMGNSTGGLHLYVDAFDDEVAALPSLQGGFIWDWCDQGLVTQLNEGPCHPAAIGVSASSDDHYSPSEVVQRQDSSGASSGGISKHASPPSTTVGDTGGGVGTSNGQLQRWCWGYGGDFGNKLEQMSDGPFCMNGLVDADRTLHPGTAEVAHLSSPIALRVAASPPASSINDKGKKSKTNEASKEGLWVEVWNKFSFTPLSPEWGELQWQLLTTTSGAHATSANKEAKTSSRSQKSSAAAKSVDVKSTKDVAESSTIGGIGGISGNGELSAHVLASGTVALPWIAPGKRAICWVPYGEGEGGAAAAFDGIYGSPKNDGVSPYTPTMWLHVSACQTKAPSWAPLQNNWPLVHLSVNLSTSSESPLRSRSSSIKKNSKATCGSNRNKSMNSSFPPVLELAGQALLPPDGNAGGSSAPVSSPTPLSAEGLVVEYDTPTVGYLTIRWTSPDTTSPTTITTPSKRSSARLTPRSNPLLSPPSSSSSSSASSSLAESARCFVVLSCADGSIVHFVNHGEVLVDCPSFRRRCVMEKEAKQEEKKEAEGASSSRDESMHCLWRAPTDNDCGGVHELLSMLAGHRLADLLAPFLAPLLGWHFRNFEPLRGPTAGASYDQQWRAAGLDNLVFTALGPGNVTVERFNTKTPKNAESQEGRSSTKSNSLRSPSSSSVKSVCEDDSALSVCTCVRVTVRSRAQKAPPPTSKEKQRHWWQLPGFLLRRCLEAVSWMISSSYVVPECKAVIEVHAPTQPEISTAAPAPPGSSSPSSSASSSKTKTKTSATRMPPSPTSAGLELRLAVEMTVASWVPPLPRVGIKLGLPPSFREVAWLGLGPHESYVDRQRASQFGRWQLDVRDQNARVPYARPQEFGGRAGTEWVHVKPLGIDHPRHPLALDASSSPSSSPTSPAPSPRSTSAAAAAALRGWGRPGRGGGLLVRASSASDDGNAPAHGLSAPGLQHSVTPYSMPALALANHAMDLDESLAAYDTASWNHATSLDEASARQSLCQATSTQGGGDAEEAVHDEGVEGGALSAAASRTWLHVDGFSMGIGGDDSWSPRTHPQYLLQRHKGSAYKYSPPSIGNPSVLPTASDASAAPTNDSTPPSGETPATCGSVYAYELWIGATSPRQTPEEAAAVPARKLKQGQ